MGIITNHYKDPYYPANIMECHKGFERGSGKTLGHWLGFFSLSLCDPGRFFQRDDLCVFLTWLVVIVHEHS